MCGEQVTREELSVQQVIQKHDFRLDVNYYQDNQLKIRAGWHEHTLKDWCVTVSFLFTVIRLLLQCELNNDNRSEGMFLIRHKDMFIFRERQQNSCVMIHRGDAAG